jgi:hypothetical protein
MNKKLYFLLLFLSLHSIEAGRQEEWTNTHNAPYTIFFQGNASSQVQLAKYLPEFITTTGQKASCPEHKRINIIFKPFIGKELDEVKPLSNKLSSTDKAYATFNAKIQRYWYGYTLTQSKPNDEDISGHAVNVKKINLGQDIDIAEHKTRYALFKKQHPDAQCILFGISRGAATTFNSEALHKFPAQLIILEGCFTTVTDVLQKRYGKLHTLAQRLLTRFTSYNPQGHSPADLCKDFPAGIPVVFISSKKDREVHYELTHKLAHTLAAQKQNDVYLITLDNSSHSGYALDNQTDRQKYQACMHAIYKKYNLPYIEQYALEGEKYVPDCLLKS